MPVYTVPVVRGMDPSIVFDWSSFMATWCKRRGGGVGFIM